jgi:Na+-transporting methylmalonyl-CoA/oxaloacetate decarboxylase gamma subunit
MGEEKKPKKRAEKYETKVAVKGTLEDMIAAALKPKKKEPKKPD